jgi:anti-sigma regulatory factor (Ser/Thr protein kinase)
MGGHESRSPSEPCRIVGPDAVHLATDAAHHFSGAEGLDGNDAARLAIIIEELVTNLYEHGGVRSDDIVELMLRREGAAVAITITDPGTSFDPRSVAMPDLPPEQGGGVGIGLVKGWAEIVGYRSFEGRNRLDLRMPLVGGG